MNRVLKIVLFILSVLYPFTILIGFLWFKASPRVLVLALVAIGLVYFITYSGDGKSKGFRGIQFWVMTIVVAALAFLTFLTENAGLLKLYPVIINISLLASFGFTLFRGPSMIYRFAILKDKSIPDSADNKAIKSYCMVVTRIWCIFFIFNGSVSALTAFLADEIIWAIYNGFISYIFIGALLAGEYLYRKVKLSR
ncbi:MAG: hypothetical protein JW822_12990 [Spirochaetales bacterium]|nr:hypothetical protein [Spirochaetales bacterium]